MPVAPVACLVPNCILGEDGGLFWTSVHCQTHVEARQDMRDHLEVHKIAQQDAATAAAALHAPGPGPDILAPQRSTTEKLSRPRITEGSDDIQWETFLKQFTRYKRVTGVLDSKLWTSSGIV
jgi:hypothetical protein